MMQKEGGIHLRLGKIKKATLQDTSLEHLHSCRLRKPYLLVHDGGCTHAFLIRDIRVIDAHHAPLCKEPPLGMTFLNQMKREMCPHCTHNAAQIVTLNDKASSKMPAIWCIACYRAFHYDDMTNQLLYGDFEAYRIDDLATTTTWPNFTPGAQTKGALW